MSPHLAPVVAVTLTGVLGWAAVVASGAAPAARPAGALTPLQAPITQTGLRPIRDIAFDPLGRGLRMYVTGQGSGVQSTLSRDWRSGSLARPRTGNCSTRRGLVGRSCRTPAQIEVSADRRNAYVIGDYHGSAAITAFTFARDRSLTPLPDGAVSALGNRVRSFVLSGDGRNAYVAADRSVVALTRNRTSGRLARARGYEDCHQRRKGCPLLRGVFRAGGIALSSDGRSLYATSERGVAILRRSTRTGALRQLAGPAGCIAPVPIDGCAVGHDVGGSDAPSALTGKFAARRIVVSPDGERVFAASSTGIAVFARSAADGSLRQLPGAAGCISSAAQSLCTPVRALRSVRAIALTADGGTLYATTRDAGVAVLRRLPGNGGLAQLAGADGCVNATGLGGCTAVAGWTAPFSLAVSPDDRHLYVGSETGVLTVFFRQR